MADHFHELIVAHASAPGGVEWLRGVELEALQQAADRGDIWPLRLPTNVDECGWSPVALRFDRIVWRYRDGVTDIETDTDCVYIRDAGGGE